MLDDHSEKLLIELGEHGFLRAEPTVKESFVRLSPQERIARMANGHSGQVMQKVTARAWHLYLCKKPDGNGRYVGTAVTHPDGGVQLGAFVEPDLSMLARRFRWLTD